MNPFKFETWQKNGAHIFKLVLQQVWQTKPFLRSVSLQEYSQQYFYPYKTEERYSLRD